MKLICLVSCVAEKRPGTHKAKDLYCSDWFKKAQAFVESTRAPWLILSALHQVVDPETELPAYDFSLSAGGGNNREQRRIWGNACADLLRIRYEPKGTTFNILAGHLYREFLVPALIRKGFGVHVPMAGMGIGAQKRWLAAETACERSRISEEAAKSHMIPGLTSWTRFDPAFPDVCRWHASLQLAFKELGGDMFVPKHRLRAAALYRSDETIPEQEEQHPS